MTARDKAQPCPDCGTHHNPLDHAARATRLTELLHTTINAAADAGMTHFELMCLAAAIAGYAADGLVGGRMAHAQSLVDMMLHSPGQRLAERSGGADA